MVSDFQNTAEEFGHDPNSPNIHTMEEECRPCFSTVFHRDNQESVPSRCIRSVKEALFQREQLILSEESHCQAPHAQTNSHVVAHLIDARSLANIDICHDDSAPTNNSNTRETVDGMMILEKEEETGFLGET